MSATDWTTPADVRAQLQRLWKRGDLLRAITRDDVLTWPLRLVLKAPAAIDLTERFDEVRKWVRGLSAAPHIRIEWREWTHRIQGRQRLPAALEVDRLADALAIIDKASEARRYEALWRQTATEQPALLPWLVRYPLLALDLAVQWDRLLAVVGWVQAHPRPDVYLRQVDVSGVDSKFIEVHRATLAQWLDLALPSEAIDFTATGVAGFARRYGFRDKPVRIRFRLLDVGLPSLPGCDGLPDIALDEDSFSSLALPVARVFITENEVNFLAFPPVAKSIVVFGAGYGWEALARASWLHGCALYYWGDIDTHGFAILDSLRARFPHVISFLMDRQTLVAHRLHWGNEPQPARHDLVRLTDAEAALYDALRVDPAMQGARLEQERVEYRWLTECLERICNPLSR